MRKSRFHFSGIFLAVSILTGIFINPRLMADDQPPLFSDDAAKVVYFVPQFSDFQEISEQNLYFLKKIIKRAEKNNIKAVIFELDTPGGRVDIAMKYISVMSKSKVPTIAFINPQGISAGAIIALGADRIAINPHGLIGDAMPLQISTEGVRPVTDAPEPEKKPGPTTTKPTDNKEKTEPAVTEKPENKEKTDKPAPQDKAEEKTDKAPQKDKAEEKKITKKEEKPQKQPGIEDLLKEFEKLTKQKSKNISDQDKKLVDRKYLTFFFKTLQVMAEKNNRPVRVIRAMADPYQKLTVKEDGIKHDKVSPLTLSAVEAQKLHVVDYLCRDKEEVLEQLGLSDCKVITIKKTPTEQIMSFLAHPLLAGILLVLGIIGIYIEIKTPGFGVPGILGITALTLFFLGHMASGASDWGPIVIFFVGIMLLLIEIFLIPGFGLVGIMGILCILISFFAAFGLENIETAVNVVGLSLLVAVTLIILLTVYVLPRSALFKRLTLSTQEKSSEGFTSPRQEDESLLGKTGIAYTPLRPSGAVLIDFKRYDATTKGEFIEKGEEIVVLQLNGFQIVVERA